MNNILERIVQKKTQELKKLRFEYSRSFKDEQDLRSPCRFRTVFQSHNPVIIGEIKRRSPSKGNLNAIPDPGTLAERYIRAGIGALSVLTDEHFFAGSSEDLAYLSRNPATAGYPKLRKDFIIDPVQLYQSARIGADAVLLIARLLTGSLRMMIETARALKLDALVEVHNREELEKALDAGADIIGVNNRDLQTFNVDLSVSFDLIGYIPNHVVAITESGIHDASVARSLYEAGYSGLLMGEALVTSPEPGQLITNITRGIGESETTD